jgi:hypothetical protein
MQNHFPLTFLLLSRLMESYNLRDSYTPDLPGLHVRIYQFRELLRQHLPALSAHLDDLQVDPAYVSQWFLSFFAVTSPLPMLFRIFDVIFAEGASETIMRVALSLMQKNQGRLLACTELEDAMQLLLSRGLWDCYHYNAEELVQDFTSLSEVVSTEKLAALEQGYRAAQISISTSGANATRMSDVSTAASRFLGRLWASGSGGAPTSNTSPFSLKNAAATTTTTLSPGLNAPTRPLSMLRRTPSKQSLASTLNSMESSGSVLSSASTEATFISRDSSASDDPATATGTNAPGAKAVAANRPNNNSDSRYLHSQIEDLLTALSDLQRQQAQLADELQREREQRIEDGKSVQALIGALRRKHDSGPPPPPKSVRTGGVVLRRTEVFESPEKRSSGASIAGKQGPQPLDEELSKLLVEVEKRFGPGTDNRRSSITQTKTQLRDELARAKEQLANELAKGQDNSRRVTDMEQETNTIKDQLRESHAHVRSLHQDKQRLEKQIHDLKLRGGIADPSITTPAMAIVEAASDWWGRTNAAAGASEPLPSKPGGGLRELKLGRSRSTPSGASSVFGSKRTSTLFVKGSRESTAPGGANSEHEALLLELVQAKTAEAVARQEADESKQKLESLRRQFGLPPGGEAMQSGTMATTAAAQAQAAASAAMGMLGRFTGSIATENGGAKTAGGVTAPATTAAAATAAATNGVTNGASNTTSSYGGFFGWRR